MRGGPAHQDTFDPKLALQKRHGEKSQFRGGAKLQASPWKFQKHGQGGLELYRLAIIDAGDTVGAAHGEGATILTHGQGIHVRGLRA